MADGDDRQATFGSDGSLETDTTPDATGENDFGEPKEPNETDGGYSRYVVSSLLQKAVRRSDEEVAAWAAWELARSGYAWNLWDRLNLYVVEDLRAGSDVALTIERYEELATERWDPAEWKGRLCAIHAALAAARATSTREASNADAYFSAVAERRAAARERGEAPAHDFPVGEPEPGGEFDAIFDGHTAEGSRLGRGTRFFKTHGARVGPRGEDEQSARWQRLAMLLDEDRDYTEAELTRAVEPVDPGDPWANADEAPDETGERGDTVEAGATDPDGVDDDEETESRGTPGSEDRHGSLSDFSE